MDSQIDPKELSGALSWSGEGTSQTLPVVLPVFAHMPGIRAFFTTRRGGYSTGAHDALNLGPHCGDDPESVRKNWGVLLESQSLPGRDPVLPRLCHGATMVDADDPSAVGTSDADAVFTGTPGRVVAVTMADCLTALIADPVSGGVAAVHAGWRGTRDNILGRALGQLFARGLCRPETTWVALGPCLSPAALEIGEDVAASLPRDHVLLLPTFGTDSGLRPHFDLRGCNRAQAMAAGLSPDHITDAGGCTRDNPDLFFSHRRAQADGTGVTGRMAACIALL
jgi:YfiH family protein